ncbi:hypothetical protein [Candidatus Nanohalovita haloferacivicina]|uniref:hypothetical protein n=1 Tax=Candidatus Nanohalovita haloferacivicina TaxID=2978046 RepID=UPI00325F999C|nr:hypothetical protein HBNXNv_0018 [Candidatus Nanohalobia archaeon BNXNv]
MSSTDFEDSLADALAEAKNQAPEMDEPDVDPEDLKKEIRRLHDRLRRLEEAHNGGEVLVEQDDYSDLNEHDLRQRMKEVEISQDIMESRLEEELEDFKDELFEDFFSDVEERLAEEHLKKRVNSIRSDADKQIEELRERVQDVQIEEKVDKEDLDERVENEKKALERRIDRRYGDLKGEVDEVDDKVESLKADLYEANQSIGSLKTKIEQMQEETQRVESELQNNIEEAKEDVKEEIEPVPSQDDFEELKSHVTEISGLLDSLSSKISSR